MEFIRQLTASRRVLAFYAVSCILLYFVAYYFPFGKGDSDLVNQIIKQGGHYEMMNKKYYAVYTVYNYVFASVFQIMALIPVTVINYKAWKEGFKPGIYFNAFLFSLSFVNLAAIIFYFAIKIFFVYPYTSLFYITLFFTFIIFFVLYLLQSFDRDDEKEMELFQRISGRFEKFGFPNHRAVYIICFTLLIILSIMGRFMVGRDWNSNSFLNYLGAAIGAFGVIYLAFGRHYKLKKLDEFQRLKQLEVAHLIFNGLISIILIAIFVSMSLSIKIQLNDLLVPIGFVFFVAAAAIEKKYEETDAEDK